MSQASFAAQKRYLWRVAALMAFYLLTIFANEYLLDHGIVGGVGAYVLAILPALPFAGLFWIFWRLIVEEPDEYIRLLFVRQAMIASGIALTSATIWGYLEFYGLVHHIEAFWWVFLWCVGIGVGAAYNGISESRNDQGEA